MTDEEQCLESYAQALEAYEQAAYERGYYEMGMFLIAHNKSAAEAEDILRERLTSGDRRNAFNRGGDDAVRDHIINIRAQR